MDDTSTDNRTRTWFVCGNILAWIVPITLIVVFAYKSEGISEQKATGLGAIGMAEGLAIFGFVLAVALPLAAIVLLVKSFPGIGWICPLVSTLSIFVSVLTLTVTCQLLWFIFHSPSFARS